jgi:hypothetical protein
MTGRNAVYVARTAPGPKGLADGAAGRRRSHDSDAPAHKRRAGGLPTEFSCKPEVTPEVFKTGEVV